MTGTGTPPGHPTLPLSVGLLSRRSISGAIVVGVIAVLYIAVLPWIGHIASGEQSFDAGEPYVVAGSVQITPQADWKLDPTSNELFTTLTKSGAALIITGAVADDRSAEEMAQTASEGLRADPENTWVIADPQTFVTDAGDHGVTVVGHTPSTANESWFIVTETQSITILATSPDGVWASVSSEMDAMVRSVVLVDGGAE